MASMVALCLLLVALISQAQGQTCQSKPDCAFDGVASLKPQFLDPNKYIVVGGLFDIHAKGDSAFACGSEILQNGILNLQAFFWAVNYYSNEYFVKNNRPVSVGAVAFDSCMRPDQTVENLLGFSQCKLHVQSIQRNNVVAYVGPYNNDDAIRTGKLATDLGMTLVSPAATSFDLNFKDQRTLLRATPSFEYDLNAIKAFLKFVNSKHAMILYSDEPFWVESYRRLSDMLDDPTDPVCVSFSQKFPAGVPITRSTLEDLSSLGNAKYVIPFMSDDRVQEIITAVSSFDDNDKFIFILNSLIGINSNVFENSGVAANNTIVLRRRVPDNDADDLNKFLTHVETIRINGSAHANMNLTKLDNQWFQEYLQQNSLSPIDTTVPHPLYSELARTIFSVKIILKGMDQAILQSCSSQGLQNYQFCDSLRSQLYREDTIYKFINNNKFTDGELNDERMLGYVYYHYRITDKIRFVDIGTYSDTAAISQDLSDQSLFGFAFSIPSCPSSATCCDTPITGPPVTDPPTTTEAPETTRATKSPLISVFYPRGQDITGAYSTRERSSDEYGTRFDLGHKWIIALGVLAGLGILCVIVFEIYILYKLLGTRLGNQWRTMWLGQLLLFGIFLCYLVLFAYLFIPTDATCGITRFGVGVSYAICFAVLLVKLMVILTSRSSDVLLPGDGESPNYLKGIYQFLMFIFAVGVQVVIDVQWLITVPPEAVLVTANNGDRVWVCNHYTWEAGKPMDNMSDFVRTNFENHLLSLVYIMVMILITTILSLNAHGIITNHRESVFVGIASGFSIPIWLAWGLVGGLNIDDDFAQEFGDASIAFGLLLTATLILFAMFLPKVRQLVNMGVEGIYLEDDRDTYYGGSVIMAPPSYKSKGPSSVIYVNNQGIYSEPVIIGNGDPTATHLKHPGSTYSAPPTYLKKTDSTYGGSRVLRVTDDLKGRPPAKRPQSEVAYGSGRPHSHKGTLPRSRSQTNLGAL